MKSFWLMGVLTTLLLSLLPAKADNIITNIMSPIVSYQYPENFSSAALTNGGIVSPIVSYQYYEWPGNDILKLQYSPTVSYYYQFLDAPVLNIISTSRTPTTAESTPVYLISPPPPSQLMAYHGGIFTANLASIDPNQMTIVLTHGWIPTLPLIGSVIPNGGVVGWPTDIAAQLRSNGITSANIVAWNWTNAATSSLTDPKQAGSQTPYQGILLGQAFLNALGPNYSQPIHFIGHSFGTLVNAYTANYLQGANFANEVVSPTPWPPANMQMTLFDEAEVGADKNFTLHSQDLEALADANANLLTSSPYYHALPKQFEWADNYVSAFGLLQSGAANVILTNGFPANASSPESWLNDLGAFHGYPMPWYEETIQDDGASLMGFRWSFETGGWFSQAPKAGSVYMQAYTNSQWNLMVTTWDYGTNLLGQRFQEFRGGFGNSVAQFAENTVIANGTVLGQAIWDANTVEWLINLYTGSSNLPMLQSSVHPLGNPKDENATNTPTYAWAQLVVPAKAVSMSFDYMIEGDWQSDSLAAALNGTNFLFLPGNEIETNIVFSSGPIDVSVFAGQTNEFFIGIVGGTSTNAQVMVENLTFTIPTPPELRAKASGDNLVLSWPVSAQAFNLQITTNLSDPNSWVTLTNVPAIVNLGYIVTNGVYSAKQFFRLANQP